MKNSLTGLVDRMIRKGELHMLSEVKIFDVYWLQGQCLIDDDYKISSFSTNTGLEIILFQGSNAMISNSITNKFYTS